jgi:hypothetical protein
MKDSTQPCQALCVECPMPKSQDRQFNHILSALIRNAPAWFLKTLALDGDYWLHPLDYVYLAQELGRIDANKDSLNDIDCTDAMDWLCTEKQGDKLALRLVMKTLPNRSAKL